MKLAPCKSNEGSASWAVSYLLRKDETGLIFTTKIMQDPTFKDAITELLHAQKRNFFGGKIRMSPDLWDRRNELIQTNSAPFHCVGTREVKSLGKLIRDMDTTMQFQEKGCHFRLFIEPLKLPDISDPDGVAKVLKSVEAVRDLFPENLPAVFTLHTGGDKNAGQSFTIEEAIRLQKNVHIQGLIATKPWKGIDYSVQSPWITGWDSPVGMVAPKKGHEQLIGDLAELVEKTTTAVIGTAFKKHTMLIEQDDSTKLRVAIDPDRPLRTFHTSAAAKFMRRYSNEQLHNIPLDSIRNPRVREEVRQVLAIDSYDRQKIMDSGMTREDQAIPRRVVLSAAAEKFVKRHTAEQLQSLDLDTIRSQKIRTEVQKYLQSLSIVTKHSTPVHSTQIHLENHAMMAELDESLRYRLGYVDTGHGSQSKEHSTHVHSTQIPQIPRDLQIYVEVYSFGEGAFEAPDWHSLLATKVEKLSAKVEKGKSYELARNPAAHESFDEFLERRAQGRELEQLLVQEQTKLAQETARQEDAKLDRVIELSNQLTAPQPLLQPVRQVKKVPKL